MRILVEKGDRKRGRFYFKEAIDKNIIFDNFNLCQR